MAKYSPDEVGFLDEMSKDERVIGRRYGRSLMGTRAAKKKVFVRGRRTSLEALLSLDGIVAGTVVEGSMTKDLFLKYLENIVVSLSWHMFFTLTNNLNCTKMPKCTAYPGPLSVLVMDNASIHHGYEILELVDRFGRLSCLLPQRWS